jgi:hypothetical protein
MMVTTILAAVTSTVPPTFRAFDHHSFLATWQPLQGPGVLTGRPHLGHWLKMTSLAEQELAWVEFHEKRLMTGRRRKFT